MATKHWSRGIVTKGKRGRRDEKALNGLLPAAGEAPAHDFNQAGKAEGRCCGSRCGASASAGVKSLRSLLRKVISGEAVGIWLRAALVIGIGAVLALPIL
ncbi:hypothetical protein ACQKLX_07275 [Bosea sp. NPDC003192]|uniref:hypothetical protein n=1 Tax=Bosea sp. NPDC003192 TaxID=3390551 RepID=UPI003CFF498D